MIDLFTDLSPALFLTISFLIFPFIQIKNPSRLHASADSEIEDYNVALFSAGLMRAAEQLLVLCKQVEEAVLCHDVAAINDNLRQRRQQLRDEKAAADVASGNLQERLEQTMLALREHRTQLSEEAR